MDEHATLSSESIAFHIAPIPCVPTCWVWMSTPHSLVNQSPSTQLPYPGFLLPRRSVRQTDAPTDVRALDRGKTCEKSYTRTHSHGRKPFFRFSSACVTERLELCSISLFENRGRGHTQVLPLVHLRHLLVLVTGVPVTLGCGGWRPCCWLLGEALDWRSPLRCYHELRHLPRGHCF